MKKVLALAFVAALLIGGVATFNYTESADPGTGGRAYAMYDPGTGGR